MDIRAGQVFQPGIAVKAGSVLDPICTIQGQTAAGGASTVTARVKYASAPSGGSSPDREVRTSVDMAPQLINQG